MGFPLVDAIVAYDEQARRLQVSAPYFAEPETKHAMLYEEPLAFAIEGLNFDAGGNVGIHASMPVLSSVPAITWIRVARRLSC